MDIDAYLRRIGHEGPREPHPDTLRALHVRHLEAIPFENIDILRGRRIVLDQAAFFDKVVRRRRGGFCYELNGLFAALLRALGFQVTLLSGRVSADGGWPSCPDFDHLVLEVTLDRPWLVDVGFGSGFTSPLPLEPGDWTDETGRAFRVARDGQEWALSRARPGEDPEILYAFTRTPRRLEEFSGMCHFHQTSPDSPFPHGPRCARKTPDGKVTLRGDRLAISGPDGRQERTLQSPEEVERALLEHFGITPGALNRSEG